MFIDYRDPDVAHSFRCDICVVGAGAAGITLALTLADSGLNVCVLESGGFEFSEAIQSLYAGESVGREGANPGWCRLRYLGGTTNHWEGWCAPLQEVDFEARAWVPDSGWPLERRDLNTYYARAREFCQVAPEAAPIPLPEPLADLDPAKVVVGSWCFSPPTRFGSVYRQRLDGAARVSIYLHCNVCELVTNEAASEVRSLTVRTLEGKTGSVTARAFVLACGGMENTRLLLLTDTVERAGLGNRSGLLGRNFIQHIEGVTARILTKDQPTLVRAFERRNDNGDWMRAHPAISPEAQRADGLLNTGFSIAPGGETSSGYLELRRLWHDVKSGNWPDGFGAAIWSVMSDFDEVVDDIYRAQRDLPPYLNLDVKSEQAPNAASTISLGNNRDVFGLRRIRVDWQLSALDKRSIRTSTLKIAEEFGRLQLGRLQLADWVLGDDSVWPEHIWSGCHHMGTARMSEDARTGVVNADCRVHSVGNLYIAGSAVFPTGGYVPPTLTIVALALRLGDHLKVQLA